MEPFSHSLFSNDLLTDIIITIGLSFGIPALLTLLVYKHEMNKVTEDT